MSNQRLPKFFDAVAAEFGTVPKRYLALGAALGLVSSGIAAVLIRTEPEGWIGVAALAPLSAAYIWLTYTMTMAMLPTKTSWSGAVRFSVTGAVLFTPPVLALCLLLLIGRSAPALGLIVFLVMSLAMIFVLPMFAGWPVLQATSARWIDPREAFRRTQGLRWQLVGASFLLGAVNRGIPRWPPSDNPWMIAFTVFLEAIVSTFTLALMASISVAAWRHMTENDQSISFGRPSSES